MQISKNQIQRIHVLKTRMRLSDNSYRDILSGFGVDSCKGLDFVGAAKLLFEMESLAMRMKVSGGRPQSQKKYDELGARPGMASPAQLRMIEAMWAEVSRQPNAESRNKALDHFSLRICGIEKRGWLEPKHISMMVNAIKRMKRQEAERVVQPPVVANF